MAIGKLCRLCLAEEDVKINIFNKANMNSERFHKISLCLPIQVSLDDKLPKKICNICSSKLDLFHDFYNATLVAEKQLISLLESHSAKVPDKSNFDCIEIVKHELNEIEEISEADFSCDFLSHHNNFVTEENHQETILAINANTSRPRRKVTTLSKSYNETDNDSELNDGNESKYSTKRKNITKSVSSDIPQKFKTSNSIRLKRKLMTTVRQRSTSIQCRKSQESQKRKRLQRKSEETFRQLTESQDIVVCDACNQKCVNMEALAIHSKQHSGDKTYTCPVCQFQTPVKYTMRLHARKHDGITKFQCDVCQKGFNDRVYASEHKYLHSGEKPFQCEFCGRNFTFSGTLNKHRNKRHKDAPKKTWDCTICNKQYRTQTGLQYHNKDIHAETSVYNKSLVCDTCGKQLSCKDTLRLHRRTHTGHKPFTCKVCFKCFINSSQLQSHERTHTGEKPYVCPDCGRGFTQRTSLCIHQRSHTGERPYICRFCGKGFTAKSTMDSHSRSCIPN